MNVIVSSLICGLLLSRAGGDQLEIRPKHVRPSKLAELFRSTRTKLGTIDANDLEGVIRIWGSTEDLEQVAEAIARFDVPRRQVYMRYRHINTVAKLDYNGTVVVPNGVPFFFGDGESNSVTSIRPMFTEKGTIRAAIVVKIGDAEFKFDKEVKAKSQFIVKLAEMTPSNESAKDLLNKKDRRELPTFHIYAESSTGKN